ncbi:MAG: hypothetical protein ACM3S2_13170 [Ignavibacteriales bacterium]
MKKIISFELLLYLFLFSSISLSQTDVRKSHHSLTDEKPMAYWKYENRIFVIL